MAGGFAVEFIGREVGYDAANRKKLSQQIGLTVE
jgi:hypothetical protein